MTTQEVADRLVALSREGKSADAYQELFADHAVAIEPDHPSVQQKRTEGKEALLRKDKEFGEMLEELHGSSVSDPIVAGNHFSVSMMLDATFKGQGRMKMDEICLYKVEDGKIVSEQFFY